MATIEHERAYLTIAEVALELGVSTATIRRKLADGELPAVQLGGPGSTVRIDRRELDAWLERRARR